MTALVALFATVYAASLVEGVETLSVVVGVGAVQGYRRAIYGVIAGVVVLTAFILAGGIPLLRWIPVRVLQLVMGAVLLWVGQGWLRKAVLRASGRKALHDEQATYDDTTTAVRKGSSGFKLTFGTTLTEGLEVLLIVVGLGLGSHHLALAGIAAVAACLTVIVVGIVARRPLANAPENQTKLAVSTLLISLGAYYLLEGAGLHLPGSDAWILAFVALVAGFAWLTIRRLKVPVGAEAA